MGNRPNGVGEIWKRVTKLYRQGGLSRVVSGLRTRLLSDVFFRRFDWWQEKGVHVTPVGHYSPIPDTRELGSERWDGTPELSGIDANEEEQLSLLSTLQDEYHEAYASFPTTQAETSESGEYFTRNGTFETVDGEILYGIVREHTPDRIVQIGAGFSTRVAVRALQDGKIDCQIKLFKPYRDDRLSTSPPEQCEVTGKRGDSAEMADFDRLESGDILFVDSAHVVRTGNNVARLLFEVLPRLSDGVFVHFHDIFLPCEYPREWIVENNWFLNEQYAVRAFLEFNGRFDVQWMGGYMHEHHTNRLSSAFESYEPSLVDPGDGMHIPNSLWLRKVA